LSSAATKPQPVRSTAPSNSLFSSPEKRTFVLSLLLVVATLAVYNPVNRNAFVNFDDDHYILNNPHVMSGLQADTIAWAFSHYYEANWHPLTWISHALDYSLFGANPAGHHYVNVLFHAICGVLLFILFQEATGFTWRSLMVAALFTLHPINVESVAWASERKNTLSMMFLLLAMLAYTRYARKPSLKRYLLVTAMFCCGLMSKPQVITLPFVLLLWDYWPLQRCGDSSDEAKQSKISTLLIEKVPFSALSLISAVVTIKAQKAGGAIHSAILYPFSLRLENAVVSYARYLGKALWPTQLSPLYPHPLDLLRTWQIIASSLLLIAVTALVIVYRRRGYLVTGWLWFLGTLVPMIGLIQVGEQAMADRYAYLPLVGLFLMICWGVSEWAQNIRISVAWLAAPAALTLLSLSLLTYRQIFVWRTSETLWSYALQVANAPNYKAHLNLAIAYDQQGRVAEAITQFQQSIDPHDDDPKIHLGLGIYDLKHGFAQQAIEEYNRTLSLASDPALKADALSNLGSAHRSLKDYAQAQDDFAAALQLDPKKPMALIGLGLLAQMKGDFIQAEQYYSRAMAVEPTAVGYLLLSQVTEKAGHPDQAQNAYQRAKELSPDWAQTQQVTTDLLAF